MQPASQAPWSLGLVVPVVPVVVDVAQGVKVVSINKSTIAKPANWLAQPCAVSYHCPLSNPIKSTIFGSLFNVIVQDIFSRK